MEVASSGFAISACQLLASLKEAAHEPQAIPSVGKAVSVKKEAFSLRFRFRAREHFCFPAGQGASPLTFSRQLRGFPLAITHHEYFLAIKQQLWINYMYG